MIPANHPIVRAMAEEIARETYRAVTIAMDRTDPDGWDGLGASHRTGDVAGYIALLCDLTRPASRDAWVRWGIAWEGAQTLRAPASPANDHRQDTTLYRWHMLRDNPEALTAAVCAALETM